MFLGRLRLAFIWVRAVRAYYDGDFPRARQGFDRYSRHVLLQRFERAFDATLMILEKRYDESRRKFREIRADPPDSAREENNRYVDLYCDFYISLAGKDGRAMEILQAALAYSPSRLYRRALPLALEMLDGIELTDDVSTATWIAAPPVTVSVTFTPPKSAAEVAK